MESNRQPNSNSVWLCENYAALCNLPSPVKPSEWTEDFRMSSPEGSAKIGKFRLLPWQFEPLDALIEADVRGVCLQWAAQLTGKTELALSAIGYFIQHRPRPTLTIEPTLEMATTFSKDRLGTMIRDTPGLKLLVREPRSREGAPGSTVLHKVFPGGHWTAIGANAPSGLASRPIGFVVAEEVDRWEPSAGKEGDPFALALVRTESFPDAVWLMSSTPTVRGASRIEAEFEQTDKRQWFVACPECCHDFIMGWEHVKWPGPKNPKHPALEHEPHNAYLECPECRRELSDEQRISMVQKGEWRATAPFKGVRGYQLNGMVTLFAAHKGFRSRLHEMADSFLRAKKGGIQTLKVWTNTFLAQTWEEEGDKPTAPEVLYHRREDYSANGEIILPQRCVVLAVGADVQADRIEGEIIGVGDGEETWGIEYKVFRGNISQWALWDEFDQWIQSRFKHVSGAELQPAVVAIDSGHNSKMVYAFAQRCRPRAVIAVKGVGAGGMPWIVGSKTRSRLKLLKVDTQKELIYSRSKLIDHGPGYMHLPMSYTLEWFQQLTSERMTTRWKSGIPERHFVQDGRNEALDARVYAMAGIEILRPNYRKLAQRLPAAESEPKTTPIAAPVQEAHEPEPMVAEPKTPTRRQPTYTEHILKKRQRSRGWLTV
jgi:phage terminase large subunit GpA-like protein